MKNIRRSVSKLTQTFGILIAAFALVIVLQSCKKDTVEDPAPSTVFVTNSQYHDLNKAMRKLWSEHMQWTYSTVDAFFNNPDGLDAQLGRLLQNQVDIGNAIMPYYGTEAGQQLSALLTEHITDAVPVLTAAKNGDQAGLESALDDWYANAQEIGDFLSAANPNWEQHEMRHMMAMHIDQTTAYSVSLLQKDYTAALQQYQEAYDHMMEMADDLTDGIYQQFPNHF